MPRPVLPLLLLLAQLAATLAAFSWVQTAAVVGAVMAPVPSNILAEPAEFDRSIVERADAEQDELSERDACGQAGHSLPPRPGPSARLVAEPGRNLAPVRLALPGARAPPALHG
jgi:hypothetical protein